MHLALISVRIQMVIAATLFMAVGALQVYHDLPVQYTLTNGLLSLAILGAVYIGLKQRYLVAALVFGLWSFYILFTAMRDISNHASVVGLFADIAAGVLSFVALCGLFLWFRNERKPNT